jgi:pimeloyl-ACP methyl ester carboxylesterase
MNDAVAYGQDCLATGIRSRMIDGINGLNMHILEAGHETPDRPLLLLLHGFPELAFSWRKVMPALAAAGYHVVAPDQRGYGRTTGWDSDYDGDVRSFRLFNIVHDALALVMALGYRKVAAVIGHDFGSPAASWCSLLRPDVFTACVMMSAPFGSIAPLPFDTAGTRAPAPGGDVHADLAALPRPRKHYQWYYSTRPADGDMRDCLQGLHDFLRAYYHMKSADWPENKPFPLKAWSAEELAKLPTYYVMDLAQDMAGTVAPHMPTREQIARCRWLSEAELAVYAGEFARTGFQGGLQWYRCRTDPAIEADLSLFSGRTIDVPSCFIGGASDWGIRQVPGALENMQTRACTDMRACHLVDGAGHWVQQEQPEAVSRLLLDFLEEAGRQAGQRTRR